MKYRLEIDSANCNHKSGDSAKTGKPYSFYLQRAYVFLNKEDRYPKEIELSHDDQKSAHPPGKYILDLAPAVYWDRFGNPQFDMRNAHFIPDTQAVSKAS